MFGNEHIEILSVHPRICKLGWLRGVLHTWELRLTDLQLIIRPSLIGFHDVKV